MPTTTHHLPGATRCTSCRAEIVWATTTKDKPIPLEPASTPNGNLAVYPVDGGGLRAVIVQGPRRDAMRACGQPLYLSHFVSCPHADEWRTR
ncbi:hypothetical protein [Rhodococcus sp. A5(2022)]|uniref:hypothetical protein n=1 Tax=Rhodococcus sp. A5(2022) TaxID=3003588 RepID=UPI0022A82A64|nr:hypothetical protein [Rhodococcus sp. A5(2022)]MCZ1075066.1 hypothetical protein [Rhodococcus sp. A5(2022)]